MGYRESGVFELKFVAAEEAVWMAKYRESSAPAQYQEPLVPVQNRAGVSCAGAASGVFCADAISEVSRAGAQALSIVECKLQQLQSRHPSATEGVYEVEKHGYTQPRTNSAPFL